MNSLRAAMPPTHADGFFQWLGNILGSLIRFIVEALATVLGFIRGAISDFVSGVAQALGISDSTVGLVPLIVGLLLLYAALRAYMKRAFVSGTLYLLIGLSLLSWLIGT
ncbi:hypothetical protein RM530_12115 [Algiphilus sp. W345]|uniref:MFS transporter n=1 Tax=Banduia mediterranea TaxID=3075609 RepID=A0ABU2WKN4_9GAMM|nr:hypothetical protein [Algiphilus sp. W345]MDT0498103.1 hypothetical protein [Algiphilus sp. W345]